MMVAVILKPVAHLFFVYLLFANVIDANQKATRIKDHPVAHIHHDINEEYILECIVFELGAIVEPGVFQDINIPQSLICSTDNHGPTIMLRGDHASFFNDTLRPGVTSLSIPIGLVSASMDVDLDNSLASEIISFSNEIGSSKRDFRGRQTADYHGFFKVLVVRVSDKSGHSPTYNATEISNHVFSDNVSMASQYRACSNNQLSFTPASGGTDIKDGVVDIIVDFDLLDKTHNVCVNAADNAITSSYDVGTSHSYIMYICPAVVDFGISAGIAVAGGRKSWYRDTYGSSTFIQMHEIGHNLGFHHSGEGFSDYGDPTCIMGAKYKPDLGWGRMCLNAVKTWRTSWYLNRHAIVIPTVNTYSGELVDVNSVLDGKVNNTDDVVVKVKGVDEDDYYIMLHRLEGITSDMREKYIDKFANRVNIIRQDWGKLDIDGIGTTPPLSILVGSLASDEHFCKDNWSNTHRALHIKVSSIAEKSQDGGAMISVFLGSENIDCACQDSPLKIKVNFEKRNCAWVAKTNTVERCKKPGVASHCPFTCKAGKMCRADSEGKFKLGTTSVFQGCSWVKRKYTKQRCQNIEGVASTCRATCAQFMNEVILF